MKYWRVDIFLLIPVLSIIGLGFLSLSSALSYWPEKFYIQVIWFGFSMLVFLYTSYRDTRMWEQIAVPLYAVNLALLFLVLLIGRRIGGAQRWLDLGFMNFQVSELSKVSVILYLSMKLNMKPTLVDGYKVWDILPETVAVLLSMGMIYKEPDLGTALLVGGVAFFMLISTKINKRHIVIVSTLFLLATPWIWTSGLHEYQKQRIKSLTSRVFNQGTSQTNLTSQYHTNQSIIAIGSGRMMGKGYKKGTQNMLRFIPEHHTDFIFAVYAEEFGFSGVMLLFALYLLLFLRMLGIISIVKNKFSALVLVGTITLWWMQIFINIAMVSGVLPVVGIPLPFFSYGGSALLINAFLFGLVHRFSIVNRYSIFRM
jgi:rod shape determining protein RodA